MSVKDADGITHTIECTADSLFEAVAYGKVPTTITFEDRLGKSIKLPQDDPPVGQERKLRG